MRRLSIIDLTGGHQPIYNETRDLVCVCNGELYNYQAIGRELRDLGHVFATHSDVEVAIHAYESWPDDFLSRINGMFALAIWDVRNQRLLLARDRLGKKPLYYAQIENGLVFSSELRSLLAFPTARWTVDREACRAFCLLGYLPTDRTPIVEIRRLPPGHLAMWDASGLKLRRYWEPQPKPPTGSEAEEADALLDLLRDSVRLRLISDVPLGAFLSGGLDSSLVVAVAAGELGARVPTFSIAFPGEKHHDESRHARRVAEYFGCDHHELPLDPSHFDRPESFVWALDEPLADPAALPTLLLSREARKSVTVVLTGEGADEVFGGYERYSLALSGAALAGGVPHLGKLAAAGLWARGHRANDDSRGSRLLRAAVEGGQTPLAWSRSAALAPGIAVASGWNRQHALDPFMEPERPIAEGSNRVVGLQIDDVQTMLPNGLLTKVDRMTMAASLEARCPFLDYRIVNFGLGLPDSWKVHGRTSKVLLRYAARRLLPREIHERPKHTFRVPLAEWLRGPLKGLAGEAATSPVLSRFGIVNNESLHQLAADHIAGRANYSRALWALVTLHVWFMEATQRVSLESSSE